MFENIFLYGMVSWICLIASVAYAGKVELTTYYPAPFGEYKNLSSTEDASFATTSGNVGIGTTTPEGVLDITSATSGLLPPRMTTGQRDLITPSSTPPVAEGMVIFNTSNHRLEVYANGAWGSALSGSSEAWHNVGAAGEPSFSHGWVNSGSSFPPASFFRDPNGIVHLRGRVTNGSVGTIFTLPVGYRPSHDERHPTSIEGYSCRVDSMGEVVASMRNLTSGANYNLDGITFRADGY